VSELVGTGYHRVKVLLERDIGGDGRRRRRGVFEEGGDARGGDTFDAGGENVG
jgi:hypothetical protein